MALGPAASSLCFFGQSARGFAFRRRKDINGYGGGEEELCVRSRGRQKEFVAPAGRNARGRSFSFLVAMDGANDTTSSVPPRDPRQSFVESVPLRNRFHFKTGRVL